MLCCSSYILRAKLVRRESWSAGQSLSIFLFRQWVWKFIKDVCQFLNRYLSCCIHYVPDSTHLEFTRDLRGVGWGFPWGLMTCFIGVRFNLLPFCLNGSINDNDTWYVIYVFCYSWQWISVFSSNLLLFYDYGSISSVSRLNNITLLASCRLYTAANVRVFMWNILCVHETVFEN